MKGNRPARTVGKANASRERAALADLQTALRALYGQEAPSIIVYGSYPPGQARPTSIKGLYCAFLAAFAVCRPSLTDKCSSSRRNQLV